MKLASLSCVRVGNAGTRKAGKRHCSPHRSGRFLLSSLSCLNVCVCVLAGRWLTLSSVISAFQARCRQHQRCWFGAAVFYFGAPLVKKEGRRLPVQLSRTRQLDTPHTAITLSPYPACGAWSMRNALFGISWKRLQVGQVLPVDCQKVPAGHPAQPYCLRSTTL